MIKFPKDFRLPPELQWENLTLANDFMFGKVMHNEYLCTKLIRLILPDMDKSQLFPTVIKDGALPRKTFSMGHAEDKRFYIEARRITE